MKRFLFFGFVLMRMLYTHAQESSNPDEVFQQYQQTQKRLEQHWENREIDSVIPLYFQQMASIPKIEGHQIAIIKNLEYYAKIFRNLELDHEVIKVYDFFKSYSTEHRETLHQLNAEELLRITSFFYGYLDMAYKSLYQFDKAAEVQMANIELMQQSESVFYPSAINNFGLFTQYTLKERDAALPFYLEAYEIVKEKYPNHQLIGSIRDNIADIYMETNRVAGAQQLYKTNFKFYAENPNKSEGSIDYRRLISAGKQYITASLQLNHVEEAKSAVLELDKLYQRYQKEIVSLPIANLEYYTCKAYYFKHLNQYKKALDAVIQADEINEIIKANRAQGQSRKLQIQQKINSTTLERFRKNFELEKIQRQNKIKRQQLNLWIVSLIALLIVIVFFGWYKRRRHMLVHVKQKQLIAEQQLALTAYKNAQLKNEIEAKQRDLSDFAINLTQNQEWAKELAKQIEKIKESRGRARKKLMDELDQSIHDKIVFDEDTKDFYAKLDKLSHQFYQHLMKKYPDLSKNEIRLCSLIRLNINSRDIANLQHITLASLNTSRYRLRKKLNLPKKADLDDFIQSIK